jgi:hypothetical protein
MDDNEILNEEEYNVVTEKNNKMKLFLRKYENDEFCISIYSIDQTPSKKYELKANLEAFQKNRFFKIFNNIDEIMLELEYKIQQITIMEETNVLIIDIPIGLKTINDIFLEIKLVEKNSQDIINELLENENNLKNNIKQLENDIIEKENQMNKILKENNDLNNENKKLKDELKTKENNMAKINSDFENLKTQIQNYEPKNINASYECYFENDNLKIEKNLSNLKQNNDIKILLKLKNTSNIKKWKKGFYLNTKDYKNNNNINITNGKIEEEVNQNSIYNKYINIHINNLEKFNNLYEDYEFEICLFDENNNIIGNNSAKLKIHLKKFLFDWNDEDIKKIYDELDQEINIETMGVTLNNIEQVIKENLNNLSENISKDECIIELKKLIVEQIF